MLGTNSVAQEYWPLASWSCDVWLLVSAGNTTFVTATWDVCQQSGFFTSVYWFGLNVPRRNGPDTTGDVLVNVAGSEIDDHTCLGSITVDAIAWVKGTSGDKNVNVTVFPDAVTDDTCFQFPAPSSAGNFFSRSNVNTTSEAVIGLPSLQRAPLRIVNCSVVGLTKWCDVASIGE